MDLYRALLSRTPTGAWTGWINYIISVVM